MLSLKSGFCRQLISSSGADQADRSVPLSGKYCLYPQCLLKGQPTVRKDGNDK